MWMKNTDLESVSMDISLSEGSRRDIIVIFIAMSDYCHDIVWLSVVSLSSVTRVYCDKTTEVIITRFHAKIA